MPRSAQPHATRLGVASVVPDLYRRERRGEEADPPQDDRADDAQVVPPRVLPHPQVELQVDDYDDDGERVRADVVDRRVVAVHAEVRQRVNSRERDGDRLVHGLEEPADHGPSVPVEAAYAEEVELR